MQTKHYIITGLATLSAFVLGFLFANSLNRTEMSLIQGELESLKKAGTNSGNSQAEPELTTDEINAKIAEADSNANDFNFQKGLGIALYRYGAMKQDVSVIEKAIKILERANRIDSSDNDVNVALGNSHFDIGYFAKNNSSFAHARNYYTSALRFRPQDVELRTDLALTYFLEDPPKLTEAATEFESALAIDPKHEKSLQFYVQTLAKQGHTAKANEYLEKLRAVNPQSPSLSELSRMIRTADEN